MTIIVLLCFSVAPLMASAERTTVDSLMNQLDVIMSDRSVYLETKEARLTELRQKADSTTDLRTRFDVLGDLFNEYVSFNTDSAYSISFQRENIAKALGDSVLVMNSRLNRADVLNATAMYKESVDLINTVKFELLPDYLRPYYYHLKRTVYGRLADYAAFAPERQKYERLTNMYRDSLMAVNDPSTLAYVITKADQLNSAGKPREAISVLDKFRTDNNLNEHDKAICAWTLAKSYELLGDKDAQKEELLISSISDMKSAVREYISLRSLAMLIYQEGDLEKAYQYMNVAVDDAAKCNARQRIVELSAYYPMINDIYIDKIKSQKRALGWTIAIITLLTVGLTLLLLFTKKQMRQVAEARSKIQEEFEKQNRLNEELNQSYKELQEAHKSIAEISELKEVYIGRYMEQCLAYIDKHDSYRKHIGKLATTGKLDELKKTVKSTVAIDDELKAFYDQFDRTFLNLFPTFVSDFNNLLMPEERIIPKKEGSLNAELRIFALIRLGINDSDKIAKFLRYSVTTIYNYRTKVRNKAKGDRNQLEKEIAKIGRR